MKKSKKIISDVLLGASASLPVAAGALLLTSGAGVASAATLPEIPELPDINFNTNLFPATQKKTQHKKSVTVTNSTGLAKKNKTVPAPAPVKQAQINHALVESNISTQLQKDGVSAKLANAVKKPLANAAIQYAQQNPEAVKQAQAKAKAQQEQCSATGGECGTALNGKDVVSTIQEHVGKLATALQNQDFKEYQNSNPAPFKDRSNQTDHDHAVNGIADFIDAFALDPAGLINDTINEAGGINAIVSDPIQAIAKVGVKVIGVEPTKDLLHVVSFAVVATRETAGMTLSDLLVPAGLSILPALTGGIAGAVPFALAGSALGALSPTSIIPALLGGVIGALLASIPGTINGLISGIGATLPFALLDSMLAGIASNILIIAALQIILYGGLAAVALAGVFAFTMAGFFVGNIMLLITLLISFPASLHFGLIEGIIELALNAIGIIWGTLVAEFSSIVGTAVLGLLLAVWLFSFVGLPIVTLIYFGLSLILPLIGAPLATINAGLLNLAFVLFGTLLSGLFGGLTGAVPGVFAGFFAGDLLGRLVTSILGAALLGIPAALVSGAFSGLLAFAISTISLFPVFASQWSARMNQLLDDNDRESINRFLSYIDEAFNGAKDSNGNRHSANDGADQNDHLSDFNNLANGEHQNDQSSYENGSGKNGTQNRKQSKLGQWWNNLLRDLGNDRYSRALGSLSTAINNAFKNLQNSSNATGDGNHNDALRDLNDGLFDTDNYNNNAQQYGLIGAVVGSILGALVGGTSGLIDPSNLISAIPGATTGSMLGLPLGALVGQLLSNILGDDLGHLTGDLLYLPLLGLVTISWVVSTAVMTIASIAAPLLAPLLIAISAVIVITTLPSAPIYLGLVFFITIPLVIFGIFTTAAYGAVFGGIIGIIPWLIAFVNFVVTYAWIIWNIIVSAILFFVPVFILAIPFFTLGAITTPLSMTLLYPLVAVTTYGVSQFFGNLIGNLYKVVLGLPLSAIGGGVVSSLTGILSALASVLVSAVGNALYRTSLGSLLGAPLGVLSGLLANRIGSTDLGKVLNYVQKELPSVLQDLGKINFNQEDLDTITKILQDCFNGVVIPSKVESNQDKVKVSTDAKAVSLPVAASPLFTLSTDLVTEIVATQNVSKVLVSA